MGIVQSSLPTLTLKEIGLILKVSEPTRPAASLVVAPKVPSRQVMRKGRAVTPAAKAPHRPLQRVAKTSASSLRKPLTSARRTKPKPRKRKTRIRKTKRTRKTIRTREIEKDKSKKTLRTSAKVLIGARRRKKRRDAELSTRRESSANARNMKSASATKRLNLDRGEKLKRPRDRRESKRIGESRKRRNASI